MGQLTRGTMALGQTVWRWTGDYTEKRLPKAARFSYGGNGGWYTLDPKQAVELADYAAPEVRMELLMLTGRAAPISEEHPPVAQEAPTPVAESIEAPEPQAVAEPAHAPSRAVCGDSEMAPEELRARRAASGMSYAGYAAACGLSKASLSRYESGRWPIPLKVALAVRAATGAPQVAPAGDDARQAALRAATDLARALEALAAQGALAPAEAAALEAVRRMAVG